MDKLSADGSDEAKAALRPSMLYWSTFVSRCITQRLETAKFHEFVQLVHEKHPLPPVLVADFFLKPQPSNNVSLDPRIPPYIQVLSQLGYVDALSILHTLHRYSSINAHLRRPDDDAKHDMQQRPLWRTSAWVEEFMFYHVIKTLVEGSAFCDTRSALVLIKVVCRWMNLFSAASAVFATDVLAQVQFSQAREDLDLSRAAFLPLLLRLVETPTLIEAISPPYAKGIRRELSEALTGFMHTMQPAPGFVERLEMFRTDTLARLDPLFKKKQADANAAMDELLEPAMRLENFVVPEIPITNSRAGLYVYLNAAGETQSSAIDLILASFDILANTVFRNECPKDAHLLRSFLINKLPLLLCQLFAPQFSTASSEFCITEALNQVDTSVFPTASLMFDESRSNNPYTESVREEFCTACALHGLVQREHLERILGETSMSYEPSLEKYSKDKLVQSCLSDPEKIQGLVREIDKMDGNVGAVCQALVELMRQLCDSKETMSLKLLCGQLAHKPQSLDIVLLFERLPTVLEPLCQLLDNWRYDDDQGEYQPIYEEFGAILLLVLAYAYRYNLRAADIGIVSPDSCVAKILNRAHISRPLGQLTEPEKGHVNGWIHGLFGNETGGLGDDLMSSCPPQDFYLVVASIFQYIVVAYSNGYLNDESLKSGIEYVVDTFLLPSLVPAIRFLADYLWVEQREQKSVIKILQLMLLPSSISGEANTMLSSVKNLIAKPLEYSLRSYQKQDPKNQDIQPLLRALKDSLPLSRRTGGADNNELESWSSSSSSGLSGAVRHTVQGLVQMHHGINVMPTSYTHRQLIAACRMVGTSKVLRAMVDEVRHQSEAGAASVVYDVVAALVCAPDVTMEPPTGSLLGSEARGTQRRPTLREALKLEAEGCQKLHKKDPSLAEAVVRLHRRVEALMALPPAQAMLQAPDMTLDLSGAPAGLGDAISAAVAAQGGDAMVVDTVGLDMGSSDLGLGATGVETTSDGDIFGGIDAGMDVFSGWDGMDTSGG
ncbi:hypothetical protein CDD80_38 [Ophiocordyceps camponoti-rufipedis]|uniref:Mediator of RNA polymerase II transcription subunit 5 n=1 Tax=Ophiocordyceps camponoti-rufipedis TaxID=2004952 RepID=A0A2C5ZMZ3_9HYPO|nr:hypothetical protein CDD80_38 [Ophiocordyceps camponoti-rufipedis]